MAAAAAASNGYASHSSGSGAGNGLAGIRPYGITASRPLAAHYMSEPTSGAGGLWDRGGPSGSSHSGMAAMAMAAAAASTGHPGDASLGFLMRNGGGDRAISPWPRTPPARSTGASGLPSASTMPEHAARRRGAGSEGHSATVSKAHDPSGMSLTPIGSPTMGGDAPLTPPHSDSAATRQQLDALEQRLASALASYQRQQAAERQDGERAVESSAWRLASQLEARVGAIEAQQLRQERRTAELGGLVKGLGEEQQAMERRTERLQERLRSSQAAREQDEDELTRRLFELEEQHKALASSCPEAASVGDSEAQLWQTQRFRQLEMSIEEQFRSVEQTWRQQARTLEARVESVEASGLKGPPGTMEPSASSQTPRRQSGISEEAEGLEAWLQQEVLVVRERCEAAQAQLEEHFAACLQGLERRVGDHDMKVDQLLAGAQDCSAKTEEHEVRVGMIRSKLDSHEERLISVSDRVDRALRQTSAILDKEKASAGSSAPGTPRSRHRAIGSDPTAGRGVASALAGVAAEAPGTGPGDVLPRLVDCERALDTLRTEFADKSSQLASKAQAGFADVRSHLAAVVQQLGELREQVMTPPEGGDGLAPGGLAAGEVEAARSDPTKPGRGTTAVGEKVSGRLDALEARNETMMREQETLSSILRQSLPSIQQSLQDVRSALDAALQAEKAAEQIGPAASPSSAQESERLVEAIDSLQRRVDQLSRPDDALPSRITALEDRLKDVAAEAVAAASAVASPPEAASISAAAALEAVPAGPSPDSGAGEAVASLLSRVESAQAALADLADRLEGQQRRWNSQLQELGVSELQSRLNRAETLLDEHMTAFRTQGDALRTQEQRFDKAIKELQQSEDCVRSDFEAPVSELRVVSQTILDVAQRVEQLELGFHSLADRQSPDERLSASDEGRQAESPLGAMADVSQQLEACQHDMKDLKRVSATLLEATTLELPKRLERTEQDIEELRRSQLSSSHKPPEEAQEQRLCRVERCLEDVQDTLRLQSEAAERASQELSRDVDNMARAEAAIDELGEAVARQQSELAYVVGIVTEGQALQQQRRISSGTGAASSSAAAADTEAAGHVRRNVPSAGHSSSSSMAAGSSAQRGGGDGLGERSTEAASASRGSAEMAGGGAAAGASGGAGAGAEAGGGGMPHHEDGAEASAGGPSGHSSERGTLRPASAGEEAAGGGLGAINRGAGRNRGAAAQATPTGSVGGPGEAAAGGGVEGGSASSGSRRAGAWRAMGAGGGGPESSAGMPRRGEAEDGGGPSWRHGVASSAGRRGGAAEGDGAAGDAASSTTAAVSSLADDAAGSLGAAAAEASTREGDGAGGGATGGGAAAAPRHMPVLPLGRSAVGADGGGDNGGGGPSDGGGGDDGGGGGANWPADGHGASWTPVANALWPMTLTPSFWSSSSQQSASSTWQAPPSHSMAAGGDGDGGGGGSGPVGHILSTGSATAMPSAPDAAAASSSSAVVASASVPPGAATAAAVAPEGLPSPSALGATSSSSAAASATATAAAASSATGAEVAGGVSVAEAFGDSDSAAGSGGVGGARSGSALQAFQGGLVVEQPAPARCGSLSVRIEGAKGLRQGEMFGMNKSDPYCVMEIPGTTHPRIKTKVAMNTTAPIWNHEAEVTDVSSEDTLVFMVFDKDNWPKKDELLGKATLPVAMVLEASGAGGFCGELPLELAGAADSDLAAVGSSRGSSQGKLRVRVTARDSSSSSSGLEASRGHHDRDDVDTVAAGQSVRQGIGSVLLSAAAHEEQSDAAAGGTGRGGAAGAQAEQSDAAAGGTAGDTAGGSARSTTSIAERSAADVAATGNSAAGFGPSSTLLEPRSQSSLQPLSILSASPSSSSSPSRSPSHLADTSLQPSTPSVDTSAMSDVAGGGDAAGSRSGGLLAAAASIAEEDSDIESVEDLSGRFEAAAEHDTGPGDSAAAADAHSSSSSTSPAPAVRAAVAARAPPASEKTSQAGKPSTVEAVHMVTELSRISSTDEEDDSPERPLHDGRPSQRDARRALGFSVAESSEASESELSPPAAMRLPASPTPEQVSAPAAEGEACSPAVAQRWQNVTETLLTAADAEEDFEKASSSSEDSGISVGLPGLPDEDAAPSTAHQQPLSGLLADAELAQREEQATPTSQGGIVDQPAEQADDLLLHIGDDSEDSDGSSATPRGTSTRPPLHDSPAPTSFAPAAKRGGMTRPSRMTAAMLADESDDDSSEGNIESLFVDDSPEPPRDREAVAAASSRSSGGLGRQEEARRGQDGSAEPSVPPVKDEDKLEVRSEDEADGPPVGAASGASSSACLQVFRAELDSDEDESEEEHASSSDDNAGIMASAPKVGAGAKRRPMPAAAGGQQLGNMLLPARPKSMAANRSPRLHFG
eukprot:TRINITY_DN4285_c0_g1_i2.p1 TRINITY_DN4285_c0_g1~~TRINITY_DN4285_c0_g1_i2.p1  ORF type:complete len:2382 (+),score=624.30 TRINITY_DN4285_c0_g1_i2:156-7301(+)